MYAWNHYKVKEKYTHAHIYTNYYACILIYNIYLPFKVHTEEMYIKGLVEVMEFQLRFFKTKT